MTPTGEITLNKIVETGRQMIMHRGYSGFSYADIADAIDLRKASIHHHFPTKEALAIAVVRQGREMFATDMAALKASGADAPTQLRAYVGFWARCIGDGSAPFCVAGMLGAELPILPEKLAAEVRAHFDDLTAWLEYVIDLGTTNNVLKAGGSARDEAFGMMSSVYGAMLMARAYADPARFATVTEAAIDRLLK